MTPAATARLVTPPMARSCYNVPPVRYAQALIPTLKEAPAEPQAVFRALLVRAGTSRRVAGGGTAWLPLGARVLGRIRGIVAEELAREGAQELVAPGGERDVDEVVRRDVRSYRQLPLSLARLGAEACEAWSFHADAADAERVREATLAACARALRRCGVASRIVEAGAGRRELHALTPEGDATLLGCDRCEHVATAELAEVARDPVAPADGAAARPIAKVATPGKRTIDEVSTFLGVPPGRLVKTLVYLADGAPLLALARGDRALNDAKLRARVGAAELALAGDDVVAAVTGAPVGFAGPIGRAGVRIVGDLDVREIRDGVAGANEADTHLVGVDAARDLGAVEWTDLRVAAAGDRCPRCGAGGYAPLRGIALARVEARGPLGAGFLGADGTERPIHGVRAGVSLVGALFAAAAQHHDDGGLVWPITIAPFPAELVALAPRDPEVAAAADRLDRELRDAGVEALYDDRDERPGSKFNDADLIGIPLRLTVGKKSLAAGEVELKARHGEAAERIPVTDAARIVAERARAALAQLGG